MSTSVQDMVRPGECVDLYYYDGETSKKQCFPTTVNTRYVQQFASNGAGSSVFTIPPQNGLQDIVCQFVIGSLAGGAGAGLAIGRGWGYQLIKQVSYRYGGSSSYFLTGDQILQLALARQANRQASDDILTLGGNLASGAELEGVDQIANVVLTLPHSTPSGVGKAHPFPSDLLTQQVQITVELFSLSDIFSNNGGTVPATLKSAQFQVQQVMLNNQGDALARRVDMAENAYAFPALFCQQKQVIPLGSNAGSQSVVLTGFRAGEVKSIVCWLTKGSDNVATLRNLNYWYPIPSIQSTYAGEIFARYDNNVSQLFGLINSNKSPAVDTALLTYSSPNYVVAPGQSVWVDLPFAQTMIDEDAHNILVHGKPITNGIVNLDITTPTAAADYSLNVSYIYNTTLLFSQGTVDFVF